MRNKQLNYYLLLIMAMAIPMMMLYTISALGPSLISKFKITPLYLSLFNIGSFGLAAILSIFSGHLFSRLSLKIGFIVLFSLVSTSYALISFSNSIYGLLLTAPLIGLSQAMCNPLTNLFIKYTNDLPRKSLAIGIKQSGVQIGALLVGAVFPALYIVLGLNKLFGLISITIILISVYLCIIVPFPLTHPPWNKKIEKMSINKPLMYLMSIQLLVGIILASFIMYIPFYAVNMGMSTIEAGALISIFGIAGIVGRLVFPALGEHLNNEFTILFYITIIAFISLLLLLLSKFLDVFWIYSATIGVGITLVSMNAIAMSLLITYPNFGEISSSTRWVSCAFFIGFAFGPLISLYINSYFISNITIWIFSLLLIMILIILSKQMRNLKIQNKS